MGWKKTEFVGENDENLRSHVVGRGFYNEIKPCKTFHCVLLRGYIVDNLFAVVAVAGHERAQEATAQWKIMHVKFPALKLFWLMESKWERV